MVSVVDCHLSGYWFDFEVFRSLVDMLRLVNSAVNENLGCWKSSSKCPFGLYAEAEKMKSVITTASGKRREERRKNGWMEHERKKEAGNDGGKREDKELRH